MPRAQRERAALEAAAATSGRAVLISGLTVMIAMAGMFLTGDKSFGSFAMATIMVVDRRARPAHRSAGAAFRLGDRVNSVRVPLLHRLQRPQGGDGSGAGRSTACCAGLGSPP